MINALHHTEELPPIVLMVGDRGEIRTRFMPALEGAGLWVATETSVEGGFATFMELQPNLVITDFAGRDHAGSDAFLETVSQHGHTPVIVLSDTSPEEQSIALRENAAAILVKPVAPRDLLARVRDVIAKSRDLRSRSNATVDRGHQLIEKSIALAGRGLRQVRPCPVCASLLEWVDRGRIGGVEYDYYYNCPSGCGLHCYDLSARRWVRLA